MASKKKSSQKDEDKIVIPEDEQEREEFLREYATEEMRNIGDNEINYYDIKIIIEKWYEIGRNSK